MPTIKDNVDEIYKKASQLPAISTVLIELINIIDNPKTTKNQITELVNQDQVLCADIFKYLGSAEFSLSRKPNNINEAIDYLGLSRLKDLVFLISTRNMFLDVELWYESVFIANTARKFARLLNKSNDYCEEIYMAGLLFTLGKIAFKKFYREEFDQIDPELSINERIQLEEQFFGLNFIDLSYKLLEFSGLPPKTLLIIKNQQLSYEAEAYNSQNLLLDYAYNLVKLEYAGDYEIEEKKPDLRLLELYSLDKLSVDYPMVKKLHEEAKNIVKF